MRVARRHGDSSRQGALRIEAPGSTPDMCLARACGRDTRSLNLRFIGLVVLAWPEASGLAAPPSPDTARGFSDPLVGRPRSRPPHANGSRGAATEDLRHQAPKATARH